MTSSEYNNLFTETYASLEKSGAYTMVNKLFGPTVKNRKQIARHAKHYGINSSVDDILKDRSLWNKTKTAIGGFEDASGVVGQHTARRSGRMSSGNPLGKLPDVPETPIKDAYNSAKSKIDESGVPNRIRNAFKGLANDGAEAAKKPAKAKTAPAPAAIQEAAKEGMGTGAKVALGGLGGLGLAGAAYGIHDQYGKSKSSPRPRAVAQPSNAAPQIHRQAALRQYVMRQRQLQRQQQQRQIQGGYYRG